jgi:cytochrome P450
VPQALLAVSYRLLCHPLKDYPGPFLAKFTGGHAAYHAVQRRLHLATYEAHRKYGPVFRPAPDRLVFNTVAAYNGMSMQLMSFSDFQRETSILTIDIDIFLNPITNKAQNYRQSQFNPQHNIFGTLDKERHRQKRRIYGQVLSDRSLRIFEPTMIDEIDIFLKQLTTQDSVNMAILCERLTADIAGQLAFGQPLRTQTESTNRVFPRAMLSMNFVVSLFSK